MAPPSGGTANYTHMQIKDAAFGAIWGSVALIWRMLIITDSIMSYHLVQCGQQLYESISFVLWASNYIFFHFRLQCIIIIHYFFFFFHRLSTSHFQNWRLYQSIHISSYKKNRRLLALFLQELRVARFHHSVLSNPFSYIISWRRCLQTDGTWKRLSLKLAMQTAAELKMHYSEACNTDPVLLCLAWG